jgi:hypothetical protein
MYHQQEEQDSVQVLQITKMSASRYVKEWFEVRQEVQLVQNTLSAARTTAGSSGSTW